MKKRYLITAMALLFLYLIPVSAFAADSYRVWIGNEEITSENKTGEEWSYRPGTKKLTLNNATIDTAVIRSDGDQTAMYGIYAEEKLELVLNGVNTISCPDPDSMFFGIGCEKHLTITGTGILKITGRAGTGSIAIYADHVEIEEGTYIVDLPGCTGIKGSKVELEEGNLQFSNITCGISAEKLDSDDGTMQFDGVTEVGISTGKFNLSGTSITINTAAAQGVCYGVSVGSGGLSMRSGILAVSMKKVLPDEEAAPGNAYTAGYAIGIHADTGAIHVYSGTVSVKQTGSSNYHYGIFMKSEQKLIQSGGEIKLQTGNAIRESIGLVGGMASINGGKLTAKAGTAAISYGVSGTASIAGGTVTVSGNDCAFRTVPATDEYMNVLIKGSVDPDGSSVKTVKLTNTTISKYKYLRITNQAEFTPGLTVTNGIKGIIIKWNKVPGATRYMLYRRVESGVFRALTTIEDGDTVSYTDTDVRNGKKYTYAIQAGNSRSVTNQSPNVTKVYLSRPILKSLASGASGKVTLEWDENFKAAGYQIKYTIGGNSKTIRISKSSTVRKTIGNLSKGKTCEVRVRAYRTVDGVTYYSPWSQVKSVKVKK